MLDGCLSALLRNSNIPVSWKTVSNIGYSIDANLLKAQRSHCNFLCSTMGPNPELAVRWTSQQWGTAILKIELANWVDQIRVWMHKTTLKLYENFCRMWLNKKKGLDLLPVSLDQNYLGVQCFFSTDVFGQKPNCVEPTVWVLFCERTRKK